MTAAYSLGDCYDLRTSSSWTVKVHYKGPNEDNLSGWSTKWWSMCGVDVSTVEINSGWATQPVLGKTGSIGRATPCRASFSQGMKVLQEKLAKGYQFASRPKSGLVWLPSPFCDIHGFSFTGKNPDGTARSDPNGSISAVDKDGVVLMRLEVQTARDLCEKYGLQGPQDSHGRQRWVLQQ